MKKSGFLVKVFFIIGFSFLLSESVNSQVKSQINWPSFMAQHDLIWEELPLQWNEGAYTGNGQVGMMIYATLKDNRIDFHLGRQDVTDHRKAPNQKTSMGAEGASVMFDFPRLDIGRMALRPAGKIISGTIHLDLWNAEISGKIITDLGEISFRAFTPRDRMINVIEVSSTEKKNGIKADYQWDFLPGNPASPRSQVFPDIPESKAYITNQKPVITKNNDISVCVQSLLAGGDYATAWSEKKASKGNQSTLFVAIANEVPKVNVSAEVAMQTIRDASILKLATLEKPHRDWWHRYYQQSFLSIPDGRMESFYWIQIYKMAVCSRTDGPAVDLFGPMFRVSQWPGLWWNLNVQLTYWPYYASNHMDLAENLIALIDEKFDPMLANFRGPKLGDFAWAMHNYWLHYRYLGDWKSIQEKWVPKAMKIAEAFEKLQEKRDNGKIGLALMGSPEYKGFVTYPDTNYNLAILRWLLNALIESNEKADLNPAEMVKWKQTLADLIPYPVDANGLMIASNQPVDMSHRHYSHLLGLYPLFQLNPDSPADRELVDKSVVHWHRIENGKALAGYSYTGAASLYAALGRGNDANQILEHFMLGDIGISQLLSNTMYVESGGRNPVLETPLSAAASIMELLLQSWGGKIRVFPAVPDDWKDASFYQLRAQGGFLVSASRSQGKTAWISLKSLSGEPCLVKIPDWTNAVQMGKGGKIPVSKIAEGEFIIDLKSGEEILLKSSENEINAEVNPVDRMKDEKNIYGVKKGRNLKNDQSWPLPDYEFRK
jgi:alpha-L-fucosidase 2